MRFPITIFLFFLLSCSNMRRNSTSKAFKEDFEKNLLIYSDKNNTFLHNCHKRNSKKELNILKRSFFKMKNNFNYWNKIGACYFMAADMNKAAFYFDMALEKAKGASKSDILNNKGVLLFHLKHYQQALSLFTKASQKNPRLLTPKTNLASLHIQFHQYGLAKKALNTINHRHKKTPLFKKTLEKLNQRNIANRKNK